MIVFVHFFLGFEVVNALATSYIHVMCTHDGASHLRGILPVLM